MAKTMKKDIIGVHGKDGKLYCLECVPDYLFREVTLDSFITRGEVEKSDGRYFCDICKKRITARAQK
jgi:hypothetical protein